MPPKKPMVLVVEDTDSVRKLLVADLAQDGSIRVEQASTGAEALEMAASPECAVVVLDMMLPGRTGLEVLATVHDDAWIDGPGSAPGMQPRR